MPAKGRKRSTPLTSNFRDQQRGLTLPLAREGGCRSVFAEAAGWGNPNGRGYPHPLTPPRTGGGEPDVPGGERHEQDHAQQGPDGPQGHDRADQRQHQGLFLARGAPRRARAVPRDRALRGRGRDPRSASTTRRAPTPTRTPPSTSRRACRASARRGCSERGGVEEYQGRDIKPEDNGNVAGQAPGPRLPQQERSPCAACPASR